MPATKVRLVLPATLEGMGNFKKNFETADKLVEDPEARDKIARWAEAYRVQVENFRAEDSRVFFGAIGKIDEWVEIDEFQSNASIKREAGFEVAITMASSSIRGVGLLLRDYSILVNAVLEAITAYRETKRKSKQATA